MQFELEPFLFSLLFSSDTPLSVQDIQQVLIRYHQQYADDTEPEYTDVPGLLTGAQIQEGFLALMKKLDAGDEPYRLQEGPHGYRLVICPAYATWVRLLRQEPKPIRLSPSALETLAIVAYQQPVTRSHIEKIRGVAADGPVHRLIELGLIEVTGRADLPGKPSEYGTTTKFLEWVGLSSLAKLPPVEGLKSVEKWLQRTITQPELPILES